MDNRAEDNRPEVPKGAMDTVTSEYITRQFNAGTEKEKADIKTDEVTE